MRRKSCKCFTREDYLNLSNWCNDRFKSNVRTICQQLELFPKNYDNYYKYLKLAKKRAENEQNNQ